MKSSIKFVLVCPGRVGSSVIIRALAQHPDLAVTSEVLNPLLVRAGDFVLNPKLDPTNKVSEVEEWVTELYHEQDLDKIMQFHDITKLIDKIFTCYNGFKLLYYQIPKNHVGWNYFLNIPNIKIIHLTRSNLLERLLSCEKAEKSCVWQRDSQMHDVKLPEEDESIYLDCKIVENIFIEYKKNIEYFTKLFSNSDCLSIEYKEIFDWTSLMEKLQGFLGVQMSTLPQVFSKLLVKTPSQLISNYQELSAYFHNTEWAEFFNYVTFL